MSLIYGYSNRYEKFLSSCEENSNIAIKKANSASYRARKASERSEQCELVNSKQKECNEIKTALQEVEFTRYGEPKTVRPFKTGIVLLGISTKGDTTVEIRCFTTFMTLLEVNISHLFKGKMDTKFWKNRQTFQIPKILSPV